MGMLAKAVTFTMEHVALTVVMLIETCPNMAIDPRRLRSRPGEGKIPDSKEPLSHLRNGLRALCL
ncbi:hypothetical protein GCM10010404_85570 [Nonomuraea africana]|uniref:Uncharacterized protein n=1 Tax=Nonomuraea africana TaxID=46171 RepID=A0ABR9K8B5_9ACTN|nr:hypothetical protein [Nonomuraea africana]